MGDKLNYIVEDNIIAEVLGRNNFSTKESAILELIKNAYDAGASKLNLIFKKSENTGRLMLEIIDDGSGMKMILGKLGCTLVRAPEIIKILIRDGFLLDQKELEDLL